MRFHHMGTDRNYRDPEGQFARKSGRLQEKGQLLGYNEVPIKFNA